VLKDIHYINYINIQEDANTNVLDTDNFSKIEKSIIFLGLTLQEELFFYLPFFFYSPPFWRNKVG
jgi:hypothetical protein